jgi:hypothetical protein
MAYPPGFYGFHSPFLQHGTGLTRDSSRSIAIRAPSIRDLDHDVLVYHIQFTLFPRRYYCKVTPKRPAAYPQQSPRAAH